MLCLPLNLANKIKDAIRSGKLSPDKLNKMTSQERRNFLTGIVGTEYAKQVNLLFEQKLLLKNQERAMYDWIKTITGLSAEQKAKTLTKIRETYAEKKRRLEDPKENEVFLNEIASDVYSKKFKTEITLEEAQNITELSQDAKRAREKMNDDFTWNTVEAGLNFGAKKVARDNYVGGLKADAIKEAFVNPFRVRGLAEKARAVSTNANLSFMFIAQNSRAIKASWDNSLWGRQGIKVLYTHPKIWGKNFARSWVDIYQTIKGGSKAGDAIVDAVKAEIYSRKNYLNGRYELGKKLDIGTGEEEFPTSLPTKIPIVGRLFSAAEVSYEAGAMRMRADVADLVYKLAENNKVDMKNKLEVGSLNELVNSMTGRGSLGRLEGAAKTTNIVFFSVKLFKSGIDTLTLHAGSEMSVFARKQAAINLLKIVSSIGTILAISNAIDDDSVEWDPRSANFGKIRVGNMRFDLTGGMSSLIILAARVGTQSTKSSVTDVVSKYGQGYGSPDGMDAIWNFTENKFSPMFSVIKELVNQKTFDGEKPTFVNQLKNVSIPILVETGMEAYQKEGLANALLVMIADGIGVSANVYSYNDNWDFKPGKQLTQFKEKIGEDRFKEANKEYVKLVNDKIVELKDDKKYNKKDDEDKQNQLTSEKSKIKSRIFRKYGFTYRNK